MAILVLAMLAAINNKGNFSAIESIEILLTILTGLAEVGDITHRDLKPSNILLHESKWKIADFGIAKFVEDSTSLETLRRAPSAPNADGRYNEMINQINGLSSNYNDQLITYAERFDKQPSDEIKAIAKKQASK